MTPPSDASPSPPDRYRADIDGLRAIAVLMVVLFHFHLVPGAEAGFLGVDVFFVISGYLITGIVLRACRADTFRLGAFYANRVRRLAPALLATLALTLAAGALWLLPSDFEALVEQAVVTQFYVSNVYFWRTINYFGLQADGVFLLHTWSLAVEEQFYLLYPAALLLVMRLRGRWLWPLLWLATIASFALALGFVQSKPEATFYLLPTRAWELLAGALVFGLVERGVRLAAPLREGLGVAGLLLLAIAVFAHRPDYSVPGTFALLPVLGAAALIYSATEGTTFVARQLGRALPVYLGRLSYPLYLVHWPIEVFANDRFGEAYDLPVRWAMFGLSLVLAAAIYHGVESPIRHARDKNDNRRLLAIYAATLIGTVALHAGSRATEGFPDRFSKEVLRFAAFAEDHTPSTTDCAYDPGRTSASSLCVLGKGDAEPTWLIYGDSHAWAARAVFELWLEGRGERAYYVYRNTCLPLSNIDLFGTGGLCRRFNDDVLRFAEAHPTIANVLLVSTWRQAIEGIVTDSPFTLRSPAESEALFRSALGETTRAHAEAGRRVRLWAPVPGARGHPPKQLARAAAKGRIDEALADLAIPRAEYQSEYAFFFEAAREHEEWIAGVYETADVVCDATTCGAMLGDAPAYYDGSHIARSPAPYWAAMMRATDDKNERD